MAISELVRATSRQTDFPYGSLSKGDLEDIRILRRERRGHILSAIAYKMLGTALATETIAFITIPSLFFLSGLPLALGPASVVTILLLGGSGELWRKGSAEAQEARENKDQIKEIRGFASPRRGY